MKKMRNKSVYAAIKKVDMSVELPRTVNIPTGLFFSRVASWPEQPMGPPRRTHQTKSLRSSLAKGFFGQSVTHWQHKPTGPTQRLFDDLTSKATFRSRYPQRESLWAFTQMNSRMFKRENVNFPRSFGAYDSAVSPPSMKHNNGFYYANYSQPRRVGCNDWSNISQPR